SQSFIRGDVFDMVLAPDVKTAVLSPDIQPRFKRQQRGHPAEIGSRSRIEAAREPLSVVLKKPAVERAYQQLALGRDQHADVSRPGFREAVTAKRLPVERHKAGTRSTGKQPLAKNRERSQVVFRQTIESGKSLVHVAAFIKGYQPARSRHVANAGEA